MNNVVVMTTTMTPQVRKLGALKKASVLSILAYVVALTTRMALMTAGYSRICLRKNKIPNRNIER